MNTLLVVPIPAQSRIAKVAGLADFFDCYQAPLEKCSTASQAYQAVFGHVPEWVLKLMIFRNSLAKIFGLKHHSKEEIREINKSTYKHPYQIGQRAGLFLVDTVDSQELIVGDDDSHLNFRISVFIHLIDGRRVLSVSTVVFINNWLGHIYIFLIKPLHRLIARSFIASAIAKGRL
jgi:Protein of unknown function (DUF2867)